MEMFGILKLVEFASRKVEKGERILDAGAGSCPYARHFRHAEYESTDFEESVSGRKHDFLCSLDNIPKPDNSYDAIISTQVLEHVEYPQKVMDEFYRVLKPGGKLFLTLTQAWGVHGEPYNFYFFTKFGLKSLFRNSGFEEHFIRPLCGMFGFIGKMIKLLPQYIYFQQFYRKKGDAFEFKPGIGAVLMFPFYLLAVPICQVLIPFVFYYLDFLDKKKFFTVGYASYCVKPKE